MPSAEQILQTLQAIVREGRSLSPILRILFVVLVVFFVLKRRVLAAYLAAYVALVLVAAAAMGIVFENHPNVVFFALLFPAGLVWGREALTPVPNPANSPVRFALAGLFALGGLFYPHFVEGVGGVIAFAPVGIVACPTLVLAHAALIATGRTYSLYAAISTWVLGAFFGLVGVFYLQVKPDWMLVAAVPVSVALYFASKRPRARRRRRIKRRK